MSKKQKQAIQLVEYFIPPMMQGDYNPDAIVNGYSGIGIEGITEAKDGLSPEEAFFLKTERGIMPTRTTDVKRLFSLLWGQRRMALHEKLWREAMLTGDMFIGEWDTEIESVKAFAQRIYADIQREADMAILKKVRIHGI